MDREDRKYALQTVVGFETGTDEGLSYTPARQEIDSFIDKLI